jgi:hypothetical protein
MQEVLPPGVGRVPMWWMEITPHYVLDLEEEEYRRRAEEQMATYYRQMAEASEGASGDIRLVDADGNPIPLGPDGAPWSSGGWKGRSSQGGGGSGDGQDGPLGRHFVPGQVTPEVLRLLGVSAESDPDYRSYLSGAKYPPGYWEKLSELGYSGASSGGFSANNLAQTDFGRYGRQAEQPKHKPSWAKMKLRSTTHGREARQGVYDTSPKREPARRVTDAGDAPRALLAAAPILDEGIGDRPVPPPRARPAPAPPVSSSAAAAAAGAPPKPPAGSSAAPPSPAGKKKVIRKVRKVRRKAEDGDAGPPPPSSGGGAARAPITLHVPPMPVPPPQQHRPAEPEGNAGGDAEPSARRYNHKDYYYNAPADRAHAGTASAHHQPPNPQQPPQQVRPPAPVPKPPQPPTAPAPAAAPAPARPSTVIASAPAPPVSPYRDDNTYPFEDEEEVVEDEEEEEIIEEEVLEEEYDDEEEGYDEEYEEVIEDEEDDGEEIEDLQAILAAKQAELARLRAQLSQA